MAKNTKDHSDWAQKYSIAYLDGIKAHDDELWLKKEPKGNPYTKGTREYDDWEKGYCNASETPYLSYFE